MKPEALLKEATKCPDKLGIEDYRDTIWLLRNKGHTWREIADFLNEKGIKTDYTRVYRIMMEGNPMFDFDDDGVIIGDILYESRKGRPLRPYRAGLHITIVERGNCFALENPESIHSAWCECQFKLSAVPNEIWLQQLHKEVNAIWNPEKPYYLNSKNGYELKFEGTVMALVCGVYNLESHCAEIMAVIKRVTRLFQEDKTWLDKLTKRKRQRNKKIAGRYSPHSGETIADICEEHSKEYSQKCKDLERKFASIPF